MEKLETLVAVSYRVCWALKHMSFREWMKELSLFSILKKKILSSLQSVLLICLRKPTELWQAAYR